ncbi:MAG: hypothetical protein QOF58_3412 [Pseudonocardiales bacterium]|jgi:hypothetical protein|nr:hypothetical protein [Pseudonocardiales bacterium]
MRVATAVLTVADPAVPRWSPGTGWVEMATARYWIRAEARGERGLVRAWALDDNAQYTDDPALVSGLTTSHGSIVDKPHRAHQHMLAASLRVDPLVDGHPAETYWRYFETFADTFTRHVDRAQAEVDFPLRYRTLSLDPHVELHPRGTAWVCSVQLALSPDPQNYWWDLARATDVLAQLARHYRVTRLALYSTAPPAVADPLWHQGWDALDAHRAKR